MNISTIGFKNCNTVKFTVRFNQGGINYSNYKQEKKGFYVHFQPMQITQNEGYITEEYGMFSGFKLLISEEKRDSKKKLLQYNSAFNCDSVREKLQVACDLGDSWQIHEILKEIFNLVTFSQYAENK
jgi:hypothetical protein